MRGCRSISTRPNRRIFQDPHSIWTPRSEAGDLVERVVRKSCVILVEGYFDVIALWQAGFQGNGRGMRHGTDRRATSGYSSRYTKNAFACFDGDDAGRKASLRALEIFLQAGLLGRGIFIPTGFDPIRSSASAAPPRSRR